MELTKVVDELIRVYEGEKPKTKEGIGFSVSRTVSVLAVMYERARNAVEFRAEHLIRRAAIERILKRRIMIDGGKKLLAERLVTELLWARYIDSSLVSEDKIDEIQKILDRYLAIKHVVNDHHIKKMTWDVLVGLASSEIDETIISSRKRDALVNFFYQAIRPSIKIPGVSENDASIYTYIAVERSYAQSDNQFISYHLLKILLPDWFAADKEKAGHLFPQFAQTFESILGSLSHPTTDAIFRFIRLRVPPYLLLRDFFIETDDKSRDYIEHEEKFEEKLTEIALHRYKETGKKVRRAVIRSFIYIFLTKMTFALALEAPYDYYIAKHVAYIPLIINTLFPPIMLFIIAGLFQVPAGDNTQKLIARIKKIVYHFDDLAKETDTFTMSQHVKRPILKAAFSGVYLATFIVTFGLINYVLSILGFSIVSKIIFVFFVALVSFFAHRIRQSAKEYEVIEHQGVMEPLLDFFLMPVIRAGQLLSREIAKINIFIFLFDFVLEAPLKVIFELVEEWIRFVRTKKDEMV